MALPDLEGWRFDNSSFKDNKLQAIKIRAAKMSYSHSRLKRLDLNVIIRLLDYRQTPVCHFF